MSVPQEVSLDKVVREGLDCAGCVDVVRVLCCYKWVRREAEFRVGCAVCSIDGEVLSWVVRMVNL